MHAVLFFGIGYYVVSKELTLNRAIVWLGMTGKIILFLYLSIVLLREKLQLFHF